MAPTKRAFLGVDDGIIGRDEETRGGRHEEGSRMIFGFPVTGPAAVTQQFFPAKVAVAAPEQPVRQHQQQVMEQCHAVAAAATANPWSRSTLRKSRRGPRSRSSQYRGVTFYRRTGRWESHIW
jgi:hypothetical protein